MGFFSELKSGLSKSPQAYNVEASLQNEVLCVDRGHAGNVYLIILRVGVTCTHANESK